MSEVKAKPKRLRAKKQTQVKVISVPPNAEAWLDYTAICELLKISRATFKAWVADGIYPKPDHLIGDRGRWLVSTHNKWITSRPKPGAMPSTPFEEN